jgi:DNA-binding response OmpR family regulator
LTAFHAQTVRQALEIGERILPALLVLDVTLPDSLVGARAKQASAT